MTELILKHQIQGFLFPPFGFFACHKVFYLRLFYTFYHNLYIEFLKFGRHFRVNGKIIVGRHEKENDKLEELGKRARWIRLQVKSRKGPLVLVEDRKDVEIGIEITLSYSARKEKVINLINNERFIADNKDRKEFEKYKI